MLINTVHQTDPILALGETRTDVVGIACCHRQCLRNRSVGGPVGQGASPPWPTTFVAHDRLRRGYLRTISQLAAITGSEGWVRPALIGSLAAVAPGRALPDQDAKSSA